MSSNADKKFALTLLLFLKIEDNYNLCSPILKL